MNIDSEGTMFSKRSFTMQQDDLGRAPKPSEVIDQSMCSECVDRINGSRDSRGSNPIPFEKLSNTLSKARKAKKARERAKFKVKSTVQAVEVEVKVTEATVVVIVEEKKDEPEGESYCCSRCTKVSKERYIKCVGYWILGDELKRLPTLGELEETAVCVRCLKKGDESDDKLVWIARQVEHLTAKREEVANRRSENQRRQVVSQKADRIGPDGFSSGNTKRKKKGKVRTPRTKLDRTAKGKLSLKKKLQRGDLDMAQRTLHDLKQAVPNEDWDKIYTLLQREVKPKSKSSQNSKCSDCGKKQSKCKCKKDKDQKAA